MDLIVTLFIARGPRPVSPALRGRPARARRPGDGLVRGRSVSRRGPLAGRARPAARGARGRACPLAFCTGALLARQMEMRSGGAGSHSVRALASRAGRGDHYLCGLTDKHISRIEQLLLPLKRRALIWALRPYPWRTWRTPPARSPQKPYIGYPPGITSGGHDQVNRPWDRRWRRRQRLRWRWRPA